MPLPSEKAEVQCVECGQYMNQFAAFICKSCRRKPLCPTHKDEEYRGLCARCAGAMRIKKLAEMREGLRSIKGFLRLLQFVFLLFSIIFIAKQLIPGLTPPYILDNFFVDYLYIWGSLSAVGFVAMYIIYLSQKGSVNRLETEIESKRIAAYVHRTR